MAKEQLIMLVMGPRTIVRQSFKTRILTLTGPGVLFKGTDMMICLISVHETGDK